MSNLHELNIEEALKLLEKKEISSREITEACLGEIEEKNKEINAYITVLKEEAMKAAEEADKRRADGKTGILEGVPIALKDNMSMKGVRTTAGSKILENYMAIYDATVVKKLKEAGAVILGKTNMDEFAMGSSTETSYFKVTKNPRDLERVPGGSSGGSAAAVAADMCLGALGSDTGGSIRQPAAFCGIVGLKPTYGAVSRYGLLAMASSLDQIGPMTKTVADAEILFKVIAGKDAMDSTSEDYKYNKAENFDIKKIKIGIPREYYEGVEGEVDENIKAAIGKLEKAGAKFVEVSLPYTKYALATYYIIMPAEVSSNLARYDGIRYGLSEIGDNLIDEYMRTRAEGFGREAKRRVMLGTYVLSAGYYDAYYKKAQKVRTLVRADYDKAWERVDLLITPTTPTLPFMIGEKADEPLKMYMSDVMTVPVNIAGLPAISIPCQKGGLPVGLQIIGQPFKENIILSLAREFEKINN